MKRVCRIWLSTMVALLLLCSCSWAAIEKPSVLIDRNNALGVASKVSTAAYPDADTVIVENSSWIMYQKDGLYVHRDEIYRKVLTQEGADSLKSLSSWFTIPYNTTRFEGVEIIRADGSVVPVDIAANSRVMIDRSQMDANIYNPNDKILSLNLPEVQVGDLIHYTIEDVFSKVRTPGSFSDLVLFENTSPILHKTLTIVGPVSLPLKCMTIRDRVGKTLTYKEKQKGDQIVYVWEGRNIPQAFLEPDMPSFHTVAQRVLVSTIPDWEWISRWYWNLSKPRLDAVTKPMKAKVQELLKGQKDAHAQIRAIFTWVSQKVRYLGLTLEENAPGYEPHSVDLTFDRRAGVCRDKAALLVAMLRLAGFDAYPVLIMIGPKKDAHVPQPSFNHAISCVRLDDGKIVLMDATNEHARTLFPPYLNNCSYLIASPQGEPLRVSPIIPASENMLHIATEGELDASGGLNATTKLVFNGINDSAYRGFFARSPQEKQRAYFEKVLKKAYPGAQLCSLDVTPQNMMDTSQTLAVRLGFRVPQLMAGKKETRMLSLPSLGRSVGVTSRLIDKMGLTKRRYPLFTRYACGVDETVCIKLDNAVGALLSSPSSRTSQSSETTFSRSFHIENPASGKATLVAHHGFSLNLPEYLPSQYLGLKQELARQEIEDRAGCVFAAKRPASDEADWFHAFHPDAVILSHEVEIAVNDEHSWVRRDHVRQKILTYAGKKKRSELREDYTPAYEQVRLLNATVTGADGKTTVLAANEVNRMDASWVGKAPMYPAAKTLVAGLPAVEPGSVIDYTLERVVKQHDCFAVQEMMSGEYPVFHKRVRVRLPKALQVRMYASDHGWGLAREWVRQPDAIIKTTRQEKGGMVTYSFTAQKVKPVLQEKDLPPDYSFQPFVALTSATWPELAHLLSTRLDKAALQSSQAQARAKELTKDAVSKLEKVRLIRDYVATHITLQGPKTASYPMKSAFGADRILEAGYGCSADRAVVLYAMLKTVGLEPVFVAVGNAPAAPALQRWVHEFASREWLEQVLVRVRVAGQDMYLNDTDEYAVLGSTGLAGRWGLELPQGGTTVIRVAQDKGDGMDAEYVIELQKDGNAQVRRTRTFWGTMYNKQHKKQAEMSPETLARYQQEQSAQIALNGVVTAFHEDFISYPGKETLEVRVNKLAIRQGDYLYLHLPGMIQGIAGVASQTRVNPLLRDKNKKATIRIRVALPQGVEKMLVQPVRDFHVPMSGSGSIKGTCRVLPSPTGPLAKIPPQTLEITMYASSRPAVIVPPEYEELHKAEDILVNNARGLLVLKMLKTQ